jgi:MOSC domain-containing protein YiiM
MALAYEVLEEGLRTLPSPPREAGTVALVVVRPETERRETPEQVALTLDGGVEGDRWAKREPRSPGNQITLMRADVARLFADGQPLSLFGDNLLVELDLSTDNLPPGTRLQIGTALCEVTPKPHTGCGKFAARFGAAARALTGAPQYVEDHLRGIHVCVVEEGEVRPGDGVRVVSRPVV